MRRWLGAVLILALVGCDGAPAPVASAGGALCVPPGGASVATAPSRAAQRLPDLTLPCFRAGTDTRIARLGVPAVINLWASWCGPCREELPAFQRYADRAGDRVRVIGVATSDTRPAAESLVSELGLRFPLLYDREGALLAAVGRQGLPVTIFADAGGGIAFVYNSQALDDASLARLVSEHLGVGVSERSAAGGAWTEATRRAKPAAWRRGKASPEGGVEASEP